MLIALTIIVGLLVVLQGFYLWLYRIKIKILNNWMDKLIEQQNGLQRKIEVLYSNQKTMSGSLKTLYGEIYRGKKNQKRTKEIPGEDDDRTGIV